MLAASQLMQHCNSISLNSSSDFFTASIVFGTPCHLCCSELISDFHSSSLHQCSARWYNNMSCIFCKVWPADIQQKVLIPKKLSQDASFNCQVLVCGPKNLVGGSDKVGRESNQMKVCHQKKAAGFQSRHSRFENWALTKLVGGWAMSLAGTT